jgi:hypothetical protein
MRRIAWISLLAFAACASGHNMLTMDSFYDIPVGATKEEVISKVGDPYSITRKDDGSEDFVFIERMKAGARLIQERRYIITLKDGVVISKRLEQSSPPATTFDSYEMQTTRNSETLIP